MFLSKLSVGQVVWGYTKLYKILKCESQGLPEFNAFPLSGDTQGGLGL
jgi:hypothetical protein